MHHFKKALSTVMLAVVALSIVGCSNYSSKSSTSNSTKTAEHSKSSAQRTNEAALKDFDKIKVGDMLNKGIGGTTLEESKTLLGKPTSTTSMKVGKQKIKAYIWEKSDIRLALQFVKNKVVNKSIGGLKWTRTGPKATLKDYNAVKEGSSLASLTKNFGQPDVMSTNTIQGKKTVVVVYSTGINKKTSKKSENSTANMTFSFINDKLKYKSQTDIK
ncbi:DUF3862 domain-containing protein [Lactobacillus xylocopicola]|uniref:DUF3862 domain-containing protein n=1 Tax=Lactobacillus xylocopicola TaxID=2976676 RepID=A0ABM8BIW0_9LACO|nr:DUF3862 domain-containing protein [Lactobacillus xylocopicola]BDR61253.1 hypothetical protein KIM322_15140 [Lactobacillus xylocopicola]